jgi:hypothetical protein
MCKKKLPPEKVMSDSGPGFGSTFPAYPSIRSAKEGLNYASKLPLTRSGAALGLAKNADRGLAEGMFFKSIENLIQLGRQTQFNQNKWIKTAKETIKIFRKVFDRTLIDGIKNFKSESCEDPILSFFQGEKRKGLKVFHILNLSIEAFEDAVTGIISTKSFSDATEIMNGNLPESWDRVYPNGPKNPSSFIAKVSQNIKYLMTSGIY